MVCLSGSHQLCTELVGGPRGSDTDVLYLNVVGMDVLVVNSLDAAIDLFEKRSAIYADRVWSRNICS